MKLFCLKENPKPFKMEDLVEFVSFLNAKPEHSSSFCPQNKKTIEQELSDCMQFGRVIACKESNVLIGLCSCNYDEERQLADCNLFIHPNKSEAYDEIAEVMLRILKQHIPDGTPLCFSISCKNRACRNFLENHHAEKQDETSESLQYILSKKF